MKEIMKIKLSTITPCSLGSYDTYADIFPRGTSIRGVTRWWQRALVGGWAYENGYKILETADIVTTRTFGGVPRASVEEKKAHSSLLDFKIQSYEVSDSNIRMLRHYRINLILMKLNSALRAAKQATDNPRRLGRAASRTWSALEEIENLCDEYYRLKKQICQLNSFQTLSRLRGGQITQNNINTLYSALVELRNTMIGLLVKDYKFELLISSKRLEKNLSPPETIGIISTLVAIRLGCFGKISRRGLGCLKIEGIETEPILDKHPELQNLIKTITSTPHNIKTIINQARTILNKELVAMKHKLKKESIKQNIPPIPVITNATIQNTPVFSVWHKNNISDPFQEIESLFLVTKPSSISQQLKFRGKLAWYLGLPRAMRGTGYKAPSERRSSPIHVRVEDNEIIISHFLSQDWPPYVDWHGKYKKRIEIDEKTLIKAAKIVNNTLSTRGFGRLYP